MYILKAEEMSSASSVKIDICEIFLKRNINDEKMERKISRTIEIILHFTHL